MRACGRPVTQRLGSTPALETRVAPAPAPRERDTRTGASRSASESSRRCRLTGTGDQRPGLHDHQQISRPISGTGSILGTVAFGSMDGSRLHRSEDSGLSLTTLILHVTITNCRHEKSLSEGQWGLIQRAIRAAILYGTLHRSGERRARGGPGPGIRAGQGPLPTRHGGVLPCASGEYMQRRCLNPVGSCTKAGRWQRGLLPPSYRFSRGSGRRSSLRRAACRR